VWHVDCEVSPGGGPSAALEDEMSKRTNAKNGSAGGFGEALSLEELAGVTGGQGVPVIPAAGRKVVTGVASAVPGKTIGGKTLKAKELNILNSLVKDLSALAKDEHAMAADVAALLAKTGLTKK
jgi:hypothetical protein